MIPHGYMNIIVNARKPRDITITILAEDKMTGTINKGRKSRSQPSKSKTTRRPVRPTSRTDFTIPIYPKHITAILNGEKDHEYRKYKLPARHMWIYETAPVSAIRYYAVISAGKTCSEMTDEFTHIERNRVFKEGQTLLAEKATTLYAHEIREFYRLKTPMSIKDLKQNGWLRSHPQGLCWVPEVMRVALSEGMIKLK